MSDTTVKCPDCGAAVSQATAEKIVRYGFTMTNPVPAEVRGKCVISKGEDTASFECLSLKYAAEAAISSVSSPSFFGGPNRKPQNAGAGPILGTGWTAAFRLFAIGAFGLLVLVARLVRNGTITLPGH